MRPPWLVVVGCAAWAAAGDPCAGVPPETSVPAASVRAAAADGPSFSLGLLLLPFPPAPEPSPDGTAATGAGAASGGESARSPRALPLGLDVAHASRPALGLDGLRRGSSGPLLASRERGLATQGLVPRRLLGLGVSFRDVVATRDERRVVLGPLARSWDDLEPYEKVGVALSYAGAAAAIAHFAGELAGTHR